MVTLTDSTTSRRTPRIRIVALPTQGRTPTISTRVGRTLARRSTRTSMARTTANAPSRGESVPDVVVSVVVVAVVLVALVPRRTTSTLVTPRTSLTDRECHPTPTAAALLYCHPQRPRSTPLPSNSHMAPSTTLCGLGEEMPRGLSWLRKARSHTTTTASRMAWVTTTPDCRVTFLMAL